MSYIRFENKKDWDEYKAKIDEAMWGVYAKDAPDGGYWELVYFLKFLSDFLDMKREDIFYFLEKPYKWGGEYKIYKNLEKLVDERPDAYTIHAMNIWDFEDLEDEMNNPLFKEEYDEAYDKWVK